MSSEGMTGCGGKPGVTITSATMNQRNFGSNDGLRWTRGVALAPGEYYEGCTPLVKETADVEINGETVRRAQYRKMAASERCFDVILRCDSDQTPENLARTLRANVIVAGEVFDDSIVGLPEGVSVDDLEPNSNVLKLIKKVCGGLGRPTDEELTEWGML